MLIKNSERSGSPMKFRGGYLAGVVSASFRNATNGPTFQIFGALSVPDFTSIPNGYRMGTALVPPLKDGGCAARLAGLGAITDADMNALGNLMADLAGLGEIAWANLAGGYNMLADLVGLGEITDADLRAKAHLSARIEIGSRPSAFDIVQAVWNAVATQYNIAGTMGNKLNSAASAGDPWVTELPGSYTGIQAGKMVADMKAHTDNLPAASDIDDELSGVHGAGSWEGGGGAPTASENAIATEALIATHHGTGQYDAVPSTLSADTASTEATKTRKLAQKILKKVR